MKVSGDEAKLYNAIGLDTFDPVNKGPLLEANEETGFVRWKGSQDDAHHTVTLGERAIRIMKILPRGRD